MVGLHEMDNLRDRPAIALALMLFDLISDFDNCSFFTANCQVIVCHYVYIAGCAAILSAVINTLLSDALTQRFMTYNLQLCWLKNKKSNMDRNLPMPDVTCQSVPRLPVTRLNDQTIYACCYTPCKRPSREVA